VSSRLPLRIAVIVVTSLGVLAGLASPALAHTEIEIDNPQAGAENVTLSLTSEAESDAAGITSVRVVLPPGIAPDKVTLGTAPAGWALTPSGDGFTVAGAALGVHTDAKLTVRIAQLPATPGVLIFKTLVTYSNGSVDRWIDPPTAQDPNPAHPAPLVTLRAAAGVAASTAETTTSPPKASTEASTEAAAAQPDTHTTSGSSGTAIWIVGGVAALVVIATIGFTAVRRRRRES
jgi:hypothetical protein